MRRKITAFAPQNNVIVLFLAQDVAKACLPPFDRVINPHIANAYFSSPGWWNPGDEEPKEYPIACLYQNSFAIKSYQVLRHWYCCSV
jgi:hypothetical protein